MPTGHHREFAEQICREQLTGKVELNGRWVYDWATDTSGPHDYGDCMAMAYALAAANDIGTGGGNGPRKKKLARTVIGGRNIGG
jgi:hypothetical protein